MKTAIIKGLFGVYDYWCDPRVIEDDVDYHVFTDQQITSKVYKIHQTQRKPKIERLIKIKPWEFLPGYDKYIWIDANIHPRIKMKQLPEADIICLEHPNRNCVYEEFKACVRLMKDDTQVMKRQVDRYREEGYPAEAGMVQTGLLIREPTDKVKKHAELWWHEVVTGSRRDQLSFGYALAKAQQDLSVYAISWNDFLATFKITAHKR